MSCKEEMPNLVTHLNQNLYLSGEWYVIWCDSKDEYQKDMYFEEIGLRAQNLIPIPTQRSHNLGGTYMAI